jgi:hypothetical protein
MFAEHIVRSGLLKRNWLRSNGSIHQTPHSGQF